MVQRGNGGILRLSACNLKRASRNGQSGCNGNGELRSAHGVVNCSVSESGLLQSRRHV